MMSDKKEARRVLRQAYKDVWAYTIPRDEDKNIRRTSSSSLYGEITFGSLDKVIQYLKLNKDDVFFDLGSGVGKVVMQVAMTTPVKKVVGVELSNSRYKEARKAARLLQSQGYVEPRKYSFKNEDILETNLKNATVIYSCSTAFPMKFMNKFTKKLGELKRPLRIVTTQELPENKYFELVDKLQLDMSWARKTSVYVFASKND